MRPDDRGTDRGQRTSSVSRRRPLEHIRCSEGDIGGYVLLPGDPDRVPLIAGRLDGAREVAHSREFRTFTGTLDGAPVSVTSTGVGGPSAAIAVDELAHLGAHTFIRVGTCGGLQPDVHLGDLVIATAAVRDEGTSHQYAAPAFPAVATHSVVSALARAARLRSYPHHLGVVHTTDSYYAQHEPDRFPTADELQARYRSWRRLGALVSEMETAPVFITAGAVLGRRVGAVLAVAGNRYADEHLDDEASVRRRDAAVDAAVATAVDALSQLIRSDDDPADDDGPSGHPGGREVDVAVTRPGVPTSDQLTRGPG